MTKIRAKIIKSGKDSKGRVRKFIAIPEFYYEDFEFGDVVEISKVKQES